MSNTTPLRQAIDLIKAKLQKRQSTERQRIEQAYNAGWEDGVSYAKEKEKYADAADYYEKNYNKK